MAQEQLELREASGNEKPVFGISEWMCYYANYDKPCPGPKALAARQYAAGVDGMSLYQSETLVRMAYLAQLLSDVGVPAIVAEQANALPRPARSRPEIGMDWHAHMEGRHSLRTEVGNAAL